VKGFWTGVRFPSPPPKNENTMDELSMVFSFFALVRNRTRALRKGDGYHLFSDRRESIATATKGSGCAERFPFVKSEKESWIPRMNSTTVLEKLEAVVVLF